MNSSFSQIVNFDISYPSILNFHIYILLQFSRHQLCQVVFSCSGILTVASLFEATAVEVGQVLGQFSQMCNCAEVAQ